MSYCRFSSDDFKSDVYCYESVHGYFTTHVAGNRIVGDIPPLPAFPMDESGNEAWFQAYKAQNDFISKAEREQIALPYAGECFDDADLQSMLDRLLMLQSIGYYVPESALLAIREELKEQPIAE